jgi:3-deoxy-manno-octulosonate cytidylyltransferase (CMP-KDO synthetase)
VGLYAYRRAFLLNLSRIPPDPLEQMEKLEQLRILGLGRKIQVGIVPHSSPGIDTPADYENFVRNYRRQSAAEAA